MLRTPPRGDASVIVVHPIAAKLSVASGARAPDTTIAQADAWIASRRWLPRWRDRGVEARLPSSGILHAMSGQRPLSSDTRPAAERVQLELLRRAGAKGRAALVVSLTSQVIRASRRAVARRHPELSEQGVLLRWAELHYGAEIAARLRARLAPPR